MELLNRHALVTGADSGIGAAIAERFAQAGADVALVYRHDREGAERTAQAVQQTGRRGLVLQGDVSDSASVSACFAQALEAFGDLDILVNSAGVSAANAPVAELADEQLEKVLRTDLMGPLFCCRAFVQWRLKAGGGGRIVNISSVAQYLPTPGTAPYGMAKAGLGSLARSLSREVAHAHINVNNIAPGMIETPMTQARIDDPAQREESFDHIPWHRAGRPDEIARLALFLASDAGDYVTGQTWTIDGGLMMQWGGA